MQGVLVRYAAYCDQPFWPRKEFGQGQIQTNKQLLITMPTFSAPVARECFWFSRRKDATNFENLLCIGVHPLAGRISNEAAKQGGEVAGDSKWRWISKVLTQLQGWGVPVTKTPRAMPWGIFESHRSHESRTPRRAH